MKEGGMPKKYDWGQEQKKADTLTTKEKKLFHQQTAPDQKGLYVLKDFFEKAINAGQNIEIQYYVYSAKKWIQRTAKGKAEYIDRGKLIMKECATFGPSGEPDGEPGDRILYISNDDEFITSAENSQMEAGK